MKNVHYLMLILTVLSISSQHVYAMLQATVGGPLAYETFHNQNFQITSPLEGTLSASAHKIERSMNAYVEWHEESPNLAAAALLTGTIAVKSAIGGVVAAVDATVATSGLGAPFILEMAAIGAGIGAVRAVVSEIQGAAVNELAGEQIEAIVKFGATQLAPKLINLDSTLSEHDAIVLGSFMAASALSSKQIGGFAKSMHWARFPSFKSLTPSSTGTIIGSATKSMGSHIKSDLYNHAQKTAVSHEQPEHDGQEPKSVLGKIFQKSKEFVTQNHELLNNAFSGEEASSALFTLAQKKIETAAENKRPLDKIAEASEKPSFFQKLMQRAENWQMPETVAPLMNPLAHMADHEPFQWSDVAHAFTIKPGDVAAQDKAFLQAYDASPELPPTARLSTLLAERRLETLNPMPSELPASFRMSEVLQHRMDYLKPMPMNNEFHNNFVQPMFQQNFQQRFPAAYTPVQQLPFGQQQFNIQPMQPLQMPKFDNPGGHYDWQQNLRNNFGDNWLRH